MAISFIYHVFESWTAQSVLIIGRPSHDRYGVFNAQATQLF